jgi:hypothetical protein
MLDTLGRKVIAALVVIAVAMGCVALKGDVPTNFLDLLKVVFGAFIIGNGVEHVAAAVVDKAAVSTPQPATSPDPTATAAADVYISKLDGLEAQNEATQQAVSTVQQTLMTLIKRVFPDSK